MLAVQILRMRILAQAQVVVGLKQGAAESLRIGSITARKRLEPTFVVPEMERQSCDNPATPPRKKR